MGDPVDADTGRIWADQRAADDQMRDRCPVTQLDDASMILRHAPVVAAANDPETGPLVFGGPDRYDPAGHAGANLVFGVGPHACPARGRSLMQLRVITEELLTGTTWLEPAPDEQAVRETPPVGGWARVPVVRS